MPSPTDPIRIYVGADRSQELALRVLDRSIRARTSRAVELMPLVDVDLPDPPDPRHQARTGFSFARFAIPALAGRKGRALYLDADMLVLRDISGLWSLPFKGCKVICQEELPDAMAAAALQPGQRRRKQCSVMLLDCGALDWDAAAIIAGLGPRYTYEELLYDLCILAENEVSSALPARWNSLEHIEADTCLVHYTDMPTQPWVNAANRNGWVWMDEVRAMLAEGSLDRTYLAAETAAGYVRPSLVRELDLAGGRPLSAAETAMLADIDQRAGYAPHAALYARLAGSGNAPFPGLRAAAARLKARLTGRA